MVPKFIISDVS